MNSVFSYSVAFLCALMVHGMVVALMMANWEDNTISLSDIKPYYIEAAVVAENPFTAREKKQAEQEKSRRDQRLQKRREVESRLRRDQAQWEKERQQRLQEQQLDKPEPVAVAKPEPVNQEPEKKVDTETVRSTFESGLSLALIEEENLRKAVTDDEKAMAYVAQIQREIIQNWSRPPSARNGMEALLRVHLVPTGEVVDVKLVDSSGNDAFDRSALLAVRKAGRFMVPEDALRFERDFREFTVLFKPEDLRL